ncbi:MAG: extracellular solute-binding protein [Deltaproteobacteria bacterium]|nr:extracellular solute-binding protein [Deltaproteobacteria bacterium]
MRTFFIRVLTVLVITSVFVLGPPPPVEADIETMLAEINRSPTEQRLKSLIDGAKKEGVVHYYGSTLATDTQDLIRDFNKRYPFIEVRYTRFGAEKVVSKVMMEHRSGVSSADLICIRGTFFPELLDRKIIIKYKSPMLPFLRKGFSDPETHIPGIYGTGYTIIYNTTRVKPAEAPKSYEDLLHPRWKGRMVLDHDAHDWFAGMIDLLGEKRAVDFLKRLVAEQGLKLKRGHTLITQLTAAGEHDLLIDGYVHNGVEYKSRGAPVDYVFTQPTLVKPPNMIAVMAKAAHPHAAALLLDYHLTKEAHEIMAHKQARWTTRADVKWLTEPGTEIQIISPFKWGRRYNEVVALFRKITT